MCATCYLATLLYKYTDFGVFHYLRVIQSATSSKGSFATGYLSRERNFVLLTTKKSSKSKTPTALCL